MTTPLERFRSALEQAGSHQTSPGAWTCPAHDDRHASLSVKEGRDGRVILNCHAAAGCTFEDVVRAVNLQPADLFPAKEDRDGQRPTITAVYDYTDERGNILFQAVRFQPKDFRQRRRPRPDDPADKVHDGWVWNLHGTHRVLYHLTKVMGAVERGQEVWIAEGEKDVHALERAGVVATCNPMGAGKWRDEYATYLAQHRAVVVGDADPAGRAHAETVARSLHAAGCTVRVVYPKIGKDVSDHLAAGLGLDDLIPAEGEQATLDDAEPTAPKAPLAVELDAFLDTDDPEYDWLLPGLLERSDRTILTGPEGGGKSTLLRQLVVQAGAGLHPFTLEPLDKPIRVLYVDLENAPVHVRRQLRPLRIQAGPKLATDTVYVTVQPAGIDLLHPADTTWLEDRIAEAAPELVVIGPLYKMSTGDPTSEEVARKVSAALDDLRTRHSFALLIEAHSPHATGGGRRPTRPYGASMWLRWPEFGIYLDSTGLLTHWRGARDEREWPTTLRRGGEWPWTATNNPREELWNQILVWVDHNGRIPTGRLLENELGRSRSSIQRAIKAHQKFWDDLKTTLGEANA